MVSRGGSNWSETDVELRRLTASIERSSTLVDVKLGLRSLVSYLHASGNDRILKDFTANHYPTFAQYLLQDILVHWVPMMTTKETESMVDIFFGSLISPCQVFLVLSDGLEQARDSFVIESIIRLLGQLFRDAERRLNLVKGIADSIESTVRGQGVIVRHLRKGVTGSALLDRLGSLPDRILNSLYARTKDSASSYSGQQSNSEWDWDLDTPQAAGPTGPSGDQDGRHTAQRGPRMFRPQKFFALVLEDTFRLLLESNTKYEESISYTLSIIIGKFARLGHVSTVVDTLFARIIAAHAPSTQNKTKQRQLSLPKIGVIITDVQASSLENILLALVNRLALGCATEHGSDLCESSERQLPQVQRGASILWDLFGEQCVRDSLEGDTRTVKFILAHKFLHSRVFSLRTLTLLVSFLAYPIRKDLGSSLLDTALVSLSKLWSEPAFVRHSTAKQQGYVTEGIVSCITALMLNCKENLNFSSHASMGSMIEGVQLRLSSPVRTIRDHGMRVATIFSLAIEGIEPLEFEDLSEEDRSNTMYVDLMTDFSVISVSQIYNVYGLATPISQSSLDAQDMHERACSDIEAKV